MNMNIRKIIMSATAAVMTLSTATCFAMIPITELNIGGVYLEMPLSEVLADMEYTGFNVYISKWEFHFFGHA